MTKAGTLAAVALVGLTLASGMALGDVLPPLPPAPTLPEFPAIPAIPVPDLPVEYEACVAMANELGGASGQAMTVLRDGSVGAFEHQSIEAQDYANDASSALALDDAASQAADLYAAGVYTSYYTFGDIDRAVNFTRDGLAPATDQTLNGTANATNAIATGTASVANSTAGWSQQSFARDWPTVYHLANGTYNDLTEGGDYFQRSVDWVAFVRAGPAPPVDEMYASMAQAQADATDAAMGAYGVPVVLATAFEMAFGSANGYLGQVAGLAVHVAPPGELAGMTSERAGGMTAQAQEDFGAIATSLDGTGTFAKAWTLSLPSRAPGCAHVG
ncbi:MAG TPA: hypothetical protein VGR28_08105 [Candidatus Thermoplasmatota archaeon]|jgi:hypothetical protein|nr:hypothetical protein [Candidatus Thermoplasmatota archaeon]